jgi:GntR family transcriptional repressor for pyruvate dehydrogenase complex
MTLDPSQPLNGDLAAFRPTRVNTKTAAVQIADQIRLAIARGSVRPGQRLPSEHELATNFGVSRAAVREAIKMLSAAQLVESTRGAAGGNFIVLPRPEGMAQSIGEALALWFQHGNISLAEVNEARVAIERTCVRLAAERRSPADLDEMHACIEQARLPDVQNEHFSHLDLAFHVAISRAARNKVLELAMTPVHLVRAQTNRLLLPVLDREQIADEHLAIYQAIQHRQPDAAEQAFLTHAAHLARAEAAALESTTADDVRLRPDPDEIEPTIELLKHLTTRSDGPNVDAP